MNNQDQGVRKPPEHHQLESLLSRAEARPRPPREAERRIRQAVEEEWQQVAGQRKKRWLGYGLAIAASVVLAVVVSGQLMKRAASTPASPVAFVAKISGEARVFTDQESRLLLSSHPVRSGQTLTTGPEGRLALAWNGGASIRLNTLTRANIISPSVLELQEGQIYVDIDPRVASELPIVVKTPQGDIRHLGTQFMAEFGSSTLVVRVREGAIEVSDAQERQENTVNAGEQLLMTKGQPAERRSLTLHDDSWRWTETVAPAFDMEGRPLSQFIMWAARQTGRTVRYADDNAEHAAQDTILHGQIDLPPSRALGVVLQTTDLQADESGDVIIIRHRG